MTDRTPKSSNAQGPRRVRRPSIKITPYLPPSTDSTYHSLTVVFVYQLDLGLECFQPYLEQSECVPATKSAVGHDPLPIAPPTSYSSASLELGLELGYLFRTSISAPTSHWQPPSIQVSIQLGHICYFWKSAEANLCIFYFKSTLYSLGSRAKYLAQLGAVQYTSAQELDGPTS